MKYHNGTEIALNSFKKQSLSIDNKIMLNKNINPEFILPKSPVAIGFTSDINLYYKENDFHPNPELIGSGFFAKVYIVHNIVLNMKMAFKVPKQTQSINKFIKEIKLLKSLDNKNILKFHGACLYNGVFGYLTEFLDSGNLSCLIEKSGLTLDWSTRVHIAEDIANGLVYLHDHFIIHRDLSAENILLNKSQSKSSNELLVYYRAVIADFGLCLHMKHVRADRMSTVGNPFYTAPENLKNESPYDYSSDVFSFGMLLCELITGLKNDPNFIPRTNKYGLDYKKLPIKRDCPKWLHELALDCCMVCIPRRPTMRVSYQKIVDNKRYIELWRSTREQKKHGLNLNHSLNINCQYRRTSMSIFQEAYPSNVSKAKNFINNSSLSPPIINECRKIYRHNSVDSFIEPRVINFFKAFKDPGYVDEPLTESMNSLDPRIQPKLSRCTSESGFHHLHRPINSIPPISVKCSLHRNDLDFTFNIL